MELKEVLDNEKLMLQIMQRVYSIGITKMSGGEKPWIGKREFKHIICSYGISKKFWFDIIKELSRRGIVKEMAVAPGRNSLIVLIGYQALAAAYSYSFSPPARTNALHLLRRKKRKQRPQWCRSSRQQKHIRKGSA